MLENKSSKHWNFMLLFITIFCVGRPAPCPALASIRAIIGFVCGLFSKLKLNWCCIVCQSKNAGFNGRKGRRYKKKKTQTRGRDKPQASWKYEVGRLYHRDQQLTASLMGTEQTDLFSVPMASSHYAEASTFVFETDKNHQTILNLIKKEALW